MFQGFAQSIDRFNRQENKNSPKAKAALMGAAWWVGQLELVFDFWDSFGLDEDECVLLSDTTADARSALSAAAAEIEVEFYGPW